MSNQRIAILEGRVAAQKRINLVMAKFIKGLSNAHWKQLAKDLRTETGKIPTQGVPSSAAEKRAFIDAFKRHLTEMSKS